MISLTKENYDTTINENEVIVIDFWGEWCSSCKQYSPIFENISSKYPDIIFAKLNTDEEVNLSDHFFV